MKTFSALVIFLFVAGTATMDLNPGFTGCIDWMVPGDSALLPCIPIPVTQPPHLQPKRDFDLKAKRRENATNLPYNRFLGMEIGHPPMGED